MSTPTTAGTSGSTRKRKHYEDGRDVQLKVLRKEESLQDLKRENLKLQNTKLQMEIDNLKLEKSKLHLEIDLLQKKVLNFVNKNNPDGDNWLDNLYKSVNLEENVTST